ncbi:AMP-binding protein [Bradyrhizobium sp. LHD-71]|uniref:AMP-binding protein n=1 Tax=Bradyrhizobium sp. LHD-71 TaxID=3072141 RepID=UPI00280FE175|nr:AMP-binding protein [Bradyrhizobium sp. LHD-71]MDQ8732793.1 AMP-binding protein [Bradyrhizobium sp. LHD-71]
MKAFDFGLRDWARREPNRRAVKEVNGATTSFAELERLANRFAHLLRHAGLRRGDHVAAVLGNGPHILALAWASYRAGLYFTPVANTLSPGEMSYVVANSQAGAVIADQRYAAAAQNLPQAQNSAHHFYALGSAISSYQPLEPVLASMPDAPIADESPGTIMLYSSGTTGAPKGIWRPLPTIEQIGDGPPPFARDLISLFDIRNDDRYLSTAPLYHAAPLRWSLAVIAAGGSAVLMGKFDAELALSLLGQEGITVSQWVPTMFHRMLALPEARRKAFRAPRHRAAYHAAAPISVPLKRAMIDWWGPIIQEYYGGSESVGLCSISTEEWLRKPGSVGRSRKGMIHILNERYEEQPTGLPGTIFFSGATSFQYFGEPEKTASRTSPQGYQTFGDIGFVDGDGYLYLSDRLDDMIISGGVNIYPQEIEQALDKAPGVAEAGVVGMKDAEFGERPIAFVRLMDTAADRDKLRAELFTYCREQLGRTKQPKEIRLIDVLPRSEAGKLLRRTLREMVEASR